MDIDVWLDTEQHNGVEILIEHRTSVQAVCTGQNAGEA